jgi:hypothetical protein
MVGGGAVPHPVFVITHTRREPWERPGGTTFHFVNYGIEAALDHPVRPPATATSASRPVPRRSVQD